MSFHFVFHFPHHLMAGPAKKKLLYIFLIFSSVFTIYFLIFLKNNYVLLFPICNSAAQLVFFTVLQLSMFVELIEGYLRHGR